MREIELHQKTKGEDNREKEDTKEERKEGRKVLLNKC